MSSRFLNRPSPDSTQSARRERIYELDAIRFFAAVAVVLYHYTFRGYAADGLLKFTFWGVSGVTRYGYLGVNLFFMISGFVILMTANGRTWKSFAVSRIARLYPCYWFCCSTTAVVAAILGGVMFNVGFMQYLLNLTMFNGFMKVAHIDGVYWTLMVELKFYFIIYALLFLGIIRRIEIVLWVWLAVSVLGAWLDIGIIQFLLFPSYAPLFIAGAAFYLVRLYGWSWSKSALLVLCCCFACNNAIMKAGMLRDKFNADFSYAMVALAIVFFFIVFICLISTKSKFSEKSKKWIYWMGALTYPLYLIHQDVGYMFMNKLYGLVNGPTALVCMILVALTYSALVHKWVEIPLAKIIKTKLNLLLNNKSVVETA